MIDALSFSLKNLLLPGAGAVVVAFVCQLLRQYIQRIADQRLREFLEQVVRAAEQIYGTGEGAAKYEYAVRQAQQRGVNATRADIEAAVYNLNTSPGGK